MKKLLALFTTLLLASFTAQAAVSTLNISSGTVTNSSILTEGVRIASIQISNDDASAAVFRFIDAPSTSSIKTNAAYTAAVSYSTNQSEVFTNFLGVIQTNTTTVIYNGTQTIAENTEFPYSTLFTVTVPAGTTVTYNFTSSPLRSGLGVLVTNDSITAGSVVTTYFPNL